MVGWQGLSWMGSTLVARSVQSFDVPQVLLMASSVGLRGLLRRCCLRLGVLESPGCLALLPIQNPILARSLSLHLPVLKLVGGRPDLSGLLTVAAPTAAASALAGAAARAGSAFLARTRLLFAA